MDNADIGFFTRVQSRVSANSPLSSKSFLTDIGDLAGVHSLMSDNSPLSSKSFLTDIADLRGMSDNSPFSIKTFPMDTADVLAGERSDITDTLCKSLSKGSLQVGLLAGAHFLVDEDAVLPDIFLKILQMWVFFPASVLVKLFFVWLAC